QTLCTPFNPAAFTSTTPGSGGGAITYQWQMSTTGCGSGFADIVGATSATYDAPAVAVVTYFRRVATSTLNGVPCSDNSNCLTVTPNAINPGEIAGIQTLCTPFNPAAFTSTTPGSGDGAITYQWQMSTTGCGSGFADIVGATSATYDAPAVAVITYFRRVAISTLNGVPCSDNSNCLTVTPNAINPGEIAGSQTLCTPFNPAAFTSTTPGSGGGAITYQWQMSTTGCGSGFADIVGATSATYDAPAVAVVTYFRRVATSTLNGVPCSDNSNCLTVTPNDITPGVIAGDQTICSGGNPAAFTSTTPGSTTGGGTISYQWQSGEGTCATATFANIVGATSATYDVPAGLSVTTSYRRVATSTLNDVPCSDNSNCITVTIINVTPGTIAASQTICSGGNPAAFTETVSAGGSNLTYQWQSGLGTCATATFSDIVGATSATYDPPTGLMATTSYRRVVNSTDAECPAISNCITVTVNDISPGVIAGSQTLCTPFNPVAFTSTTPGSGGGTITYQWQMSTTGCGSGFTDIVGATSATYDAPAVTVVTYFRRVATSTLNGTPCYDNSNCLTVTPNAINPGVIAGSQTLCAPFDPVAFTNTTPGSGDGAITYQWQMSTTGCGSGFADIVGATSATYDAPAVAVVTYFRRVATSTLNGVPCSDNSNCLTVTPESINPGEIAGSQTLCAPFDPVAFTSVTPGSNGGVITYQWQMSTTNCESGFTDIVGATSATYDAPAVTVTTYFRRVATSTLNGTPCYDNSNCLTVTASPSPILMITNPQSVCSPLTVDLTAAAVTAGSTLYGATLSYWQDPAATMALANPNAVAMSGTYYIKATTTDGCFDIEPVTVLIESCDQEGCTLGYWKNHTDRWCPAYTPSMLFGSVFVNAPSELASLTLLEALNLGGGNIYNLARQGVAALLNACSDEVTYPAPYGDNPQLVINAVNAAYLTGGKAPGRLATQLDILNNSGCPLGGTPATIVNTSAGAEEADFTMSPVPFREEITIRYNFDYKTDATIEILDASGNLIMTYDDRDAYFNKEVTLNPNLNHRDVQLLFVKVITNKGFTVKKIISTK
ncbi:hypothetical protein, partial [Flavobacterium sp.]|uniref:hypothetical protein n=1 Tax=Flavobacterium sp. TaxID=239 RepID=UPI002B4AEAC3